MSKHDTDRIDRDSVTLWQPDAGHPDSIGLRSIGFWLYMMSDAMFFAALFAAHGVYLDAYGNSGITAQQVIDPVEGLFPTLFLFASVLMFGFASVSLKNNDRGGVMRWMGLSLAFGIVFLLEEAWEFAGLASEGAIPQASAFLSDFWTIIWFHGAHVFIGLIWMAALMIQAARDGFSEPVVGRFINLRIFWFFQAVIWIVVYTYVYLMGVS
ncbi:cytochrome c oxidase subunit 3 [Salinisphaera sp. SPP-AMP-43]|uniref:cytochrome c oxidase subunit 3 n=1 Tax=Salinisphaera sp. SPP-AMP-43 TaxID=3121288 RepID=UPI003C6E7543